MFAPFYLEFYLNCTLSMEMKILHRFPVWLSRTVEKLSKSWNTRVVATTKQGGKTTEPFRFQDFKERAEELGHSSLVKQAAKYAEEMGLQLQLEYPNPTCIKHDSVEVITGKKLKAELRRCLQQKI